MSDMKIAIEMKKDPCNNRNPYFEPYFNISPWFLRRLTFSNTTIPTLTCLSVGLFPSSL